VVSISVPNAVRADPTLDHLALEVSVGDQIHPLSCSLDRPGYVLVSAKDAQAAIRSAERLADAIGIQTVPVPV
jgi:hypothetical protein